MSTWKLKHLAKVGRRVWEKHFKKNDVAVVINFCAILITNGVRAGVRSKILIVVYYGSRPILIFFAFLSVSQHFSLASVHLARNSRRE